MQVEQEPTVKKDPPKRAVSSLPPDQLAKVKSRMRKQVKVDPEQDPAAALAQHLIENAAANLREGEETQALAKPPPAELPFVTKVLVYGAGAVAAFILYRVARNFIWNWTGRTAAEALSKSIQEIDEIATAAVVSSVGGAPTLTREALALLASRGL